MRSNSNYEVSTSADAIPLNRPFIELFSKVMEAELSDDPHALTNLAWAAQIHGSMTMNEEQGKAVNDLNKLIHRIHGLVNQHLAVEISSMHTRDDDLIQWNREYCKEAMASVERIISRYKLQIIGYSFSAGPMSGCTVKNTGALAFNLKEDFDNALQFVVDELTTLGFEDVVQALLNNTGIELQQATSTKYAHSSVIQPGQVTFASSRYRGPTESDRLEIMANHPGLFGELLWQSKLKQWHESHNIHAHE